MVSGGLDTVLLLSNALSSSQMVLRTCGWPCCCLRQSTYLPQVVFKRERTLAGKSVPQGHSGSIYLKKTSRTGSVTDKPETEGQEQFHNDLRSAFRSGTTHAAVVTEIKAVIRQSLWDGTGQFKQAFHPECVAFAGRPVRGLGGPVQYRCT
jgi:hypothetical protein